VWSQSQAGGLPTSQVEGMKEIKFGTYRLDAATSFNKKFARKSRLDVVSKAIERMVNEVLVKQERNAWAVILKALAEAYTPLFGAGQVVTSTLGHTVAAGTAGQFMLQDLNNLIVRIKRINESYSGNTPVMPYSQGITDLYVSPEIKAQVRAFSYNPIRTDAAVTNANSQFLSEELRNEIWKNAGMASIFGVNINELVEFGVGQKYNTLFNQFALASLNSASQVQGSNSAANWTNAATQQICVGIDNTRGTFVRPVAVQAESGGTFSVLPDGQFDMYGPRVQKIGFYGFLEEGRICLDARAAVGIVV
jgi:hypothetical protein